MVLSANPPHKEAKSESIRHRWEMLELACEGYPNLVPDDSEIRWGSSYTIDTLKSFSEAHGASNFLDTGTGLLCDPSGVEGLAANFAPLQLNCC